MALMLAADDADVIFTRIRELANENKPKCPLAPERLLFNCLRSDVKCPTNCDHHHDWIGPNG